MTRSIRLGVIDDFDRSELHPSDLTRSVVLHEASSACRRPPPSDGEQQSFGEQLTDDQRRGCRPWRDGSRISARRAEPLREHHVRQVEARDQQTRRCASDSSAGWRARAGRRPRLAGWWRYPCARGGGRPAPGPYSRRAAFSMLRCDPARIAFAPAVGPPPGFTRPNTMSAVVIASAGSGLTCPSKSFITSAEGAQRQEDLPGSRPWPWCQESLPARCRRWSNW